MKRLGYNRFVAQGGDWGNAITELMALQAPPELIGVYAGLPVHADIRQLPVHVGAESDELPYERLLDLALVGCGLVAAPCAEAGKKDECRTHDPNPPHGSSIRPSGIGWRALWSGGGPGEGKLHTIPVF